MPEGCSARTHAAPRCTVAGPAWRVEAADGRVVCPHERTPFPRRVDAKSIPANTSFCRWATDGRGAVKALRVSRLLPFTFRRGHDRAVSLARPPSQPPCTACTLRLLLTLLLHSAMNSLRLHGQWPAYLARSYACAASRAVALRASEMHRIESLLSPVKPRSRNGQFTTRPAFAHTLRLSLALPCLDWPCLALPCPASPRLALPRLTHLASRHRPRRLPHGALARSSPIRALSLTTGPPFAKAGQAGHRYIGPAQATHNLSQSGVACAQLHPSCVDADEATYEWPATTTGPLRLRRLTQPGRSPPFQVGI